MSKFVAVDHETDIIYGIGNSVEAALNDAAEWVSLPEDVNIEDSLTVYPCTDRLYHRVETQGGDVKFTVPTYPDYHDADVVD